MRRSLLLPLLAALLSACGPQVPTYTRESFDTDPPVRGPLNGKIAVTNNGSDTLSIVDPATETIQWTVPIGLTPVELEGPHHVTASPDGEFVYVALSEAVPQSGSGPHGTHGLGDQPGYMVKIRASDGRMVDHVQVDANPGDLAVDPTGKTAFVTHYDVLKYRDALRKGDLRAADTNLVIIDTDRMSVRERVKTCPLAHAVRLSADGKKAYSSCTTDALAVVDLTTTPATAVRRLLPGGFEGSGCAYCPYTLTVAPDESVWVSSLGPNSGITGGGRLSVYDPLKDAFDASRAVSYCGRVAFVHFAPDPTVAGAFYAFVPEQGPCGDKLWLYRVAQRGAPPEELGNIVLPAEHCQNAHMLVTSNDTRRAYLVCEGDRKNPGTVVFVDLVNRRAEKSVKVGIFPDGLSWIPEAR